MPLVNVPNCGSVGIVKDLSKHELPLGAWTDGDNVRFLDGYAQQFLGHGAAYGEPIVTPLHIMPVYVGAQRWWLYAGAEKAYAAANVDGTIRHINLTRTTTRPRLMATRAPSFGVLGQSGGLLSNNATHAPVQAFGGTDSGLQPGTLNNARSTHDVAPNMALSALQNGLMPANAVSDVARLIIGAEVVDKNYRAAPNQWTSASLSGIPILNPGNMVDPPQQWSLDTGGRMKTLENWPAGWFCKSIRTYKQFVVALGNTDERGSLPMLVKWSTAADPGAVPVTWDKADNTKMAGESDIAEGGDPIIDGLQLRDSFMIYKEQSVWRMDFVGGQFVMRFQKVLGVSGAMNRNCIVDIDGEHVVLTGSDVVVHDGQSVTQILDKQARRALFDDMDTSATDRAFVFKNPFFNEVFICYASVGNSIPNRALVWNYKDKTVSYRDIPSIHHATHGAADTSLGDSWESDTDSWESDRTRWNGPDFAPNTVRVMMASDLKKLYLLDASASYDGVLPDAWLERVGLSLGAPEAVKLVKGIRARITGSVGQTVLIDIGVSPDPYTAPTYKKTLTHTIGKSLKCDCFVSGRYIALRLRTGSAPFWRLDSYDLDVEKMGDY